MRPSHEKQTIAMTQIIVEKYGAVLNDRDFAKFLGLKVESLRNKISNCDDDLPQYTQLKRKRVFMANDIAEWMISQKLKFPKKD